MYGGRLWTTGRKTEPGWELDGEKEIITLTALQNALQI